MDVYDTVTWDSEGVLNFQPFNSEFQSMMLGAKLLHYICV